MSKKLKKNLIRIIISLFLFVIVFVLDIAIDLTTIIPNESYAWVLPAVLYFIIYIIVGYDVLLRAVKNIIHGKVFDENFLMCLATLGAFGIKEFPEAVAVLLFYQIGEWFQSFAVGKSRKSIASLMDIRPDYANLKQNDGSFIEVDPSEVHINDIILVKPGEKIPLDGKVIKGTSTLDTKALTGESLPQEIKELDDVISGSINMTGTIEVKVQKEFHDSTVSKILELVENASSQKSKSENFISKFAKYYTPAVVIGAVALALLGGLISQQWLIWFQRSLNFLVVSCPCALVLSIPLTFFVGIGKSSSKGILIKGSTYLEQFNNANIFVFDKTGTLTKGNFVVTKVFPEERKEEILRLASIAEANSNHPIARSIKNAFGQEIKGNYLVKDIAGKGIIAENNEETILCGNSKLMEEFNVNYELNEGVGTIVYLAKNQEFIGSIVIADEIKEEAKSMIDYLNSIGAKTIMLTGDNDKIARHVAKELGLKEYHASLLPQNKVEKLNELLEAKKAKDILCFIGDGINDAPVLMKADIGLAMGGVGSDAAIEASDIVLMNDNLDSIKTTKQIAKKTMIIVYENIYFAIGIKLLILLLSILGLANMWLAIFADVGVSVICILNSMRTGNIKNKK